MNLSRFFKFTFLRMRVMTSRLLIYVTGNQSSVSHLCEKLLFAYFYSPTELEKSTEQILPGSKGEGEESGGGGRREKWPKQCMHM
jgi:hypothetical protein